MRSTHTYALLAVNNETHREIKDLLLKVGYDHAINDEGEIDMHGIALVSTAEQDCTGHIASRDDPRRCFRCGVHVDEFRPSDEDAHEAWAATEGR